MPRANLSGWNGPGVLEALRDRLGPSLAVENDTNLAALGEQAHGVGKGVSNFVFISVGTGIGMGIIIDAQLHRGARGAAGEIGFLPLGGAELTLDETVKHRNGSLESVASADAVVANARRLGMRGARTAKEVFESTRGQGKAALAAVRLEAEHLANAVAAVTSVLDPELVVLGGGIGRNGDLLIAPMERRLKKLLRMPPPPLVVSALGDDGGWSWARSRSRWRERERKPYLHARWSDDRRTCTTRDAERFRVKEKRMDSLMLKEALSAPGVVEEQRERVDQRLATLASRLRERPPTLALTVARGSSDHAASYFRLLGDACKVGWDCRSFRSRCHS